MLTLTIIRGLPGAGKSTLAADLGGPVFAADDFFLDPDGVYRFDPKLLPQAHAQCQENTRAALARGQNVSVANTFTQGWEFQPYLKIAKDTGAVVRVIDLFDGGLTDEALAARGLHGVPLAGIRAMRARYEHDWKAGDPRPPWERG